MAYSKTQPVSRNVGGPQGVAPHLGKGDTTFFKSIHMEYNKIITGIQRVLPVVGLTLMLAACNGNDSNGSTDGTSMDTSAFSNNQATVSAAPSPDGTVTPAGDGMPADSIAGANGSATVSSSTTAGTPAAKGKRKGRVSAAIGAEDMNARMEMDKRGYYNRAEVSPSYAGGQASLESYVQDKLEYPAEALDNGIEGEVKVQFAVDNDGKITNVTTVGKKVGYGLEEEAVKVVSAMPKWKPGTVKGKAVKTWRTLPITYRLD